MQFLPWGTVVRVIVVGGWSGRIRREGETMRHLIVIFLLILVCISFRYYELVGIVSYGVGCNSSSNGTHTHHRKCEEY